MVNKSTKPRHCFLESLECREVPAVASISLDPAGVLTIRADDTATNVSVQYLVIGQGAAAIRQYRVTHGTPLANPRLFGAAAVRSILFTGGIANDTFTASTARVPVTALGNDGNDTLTGGISASTLDGGSGNDTLRGGNWGSYYGQFGDDTITTGPGDDYIDGGDGEDTINSGAGHDEIDGGPGADIINSGDNNDIVRGGDGNDSILGGSGYDRIFGGDGNDTINGQSDPDTIYGNAGTDILIGEAGNDTMGGGLGNDLISGGADSDAISGGEDDDIIAGDGGNDTITGDSGSDTLRGNDGNDAIQGNDGNDTIDGGAGNDRIDGGADDDGIDGGSGFDHILGGSGNDTIHGGADADSILGGAGLDTLHGDAGNDTLNGGDAIDTLFGGEGDDWLVAIDDFGFDQLTGDSGRDIFWRDLVSGGTGDLLQDFSAVDDFDNAVAAFATGMDRTLNGDRQAGPAFPAGLRTADFSANPLFSSNGPRGSDINQGIVSDCKVVSSLAALARDTGPGGAWAIRRAMVDFGDGTYGLNLGGNFYRVDGVLPLAPNSSSVPNYARLGPENCIWVSIAEKGIAFADQRNPGQPNYADLGSTGADEVLTLFGSASTGVPFLFLRNANGGYASAAALGADILSRFSGPNPQYLTVSFSDSVDETFRPNGQRLAPGTLGRKFVVNHAYTVWNVVTDGAGRLIAVVLRNPWGTDKGNFAVTYSDANPNDALVRVTLAELYSSKGRLNWGTRVV